MCQFEIFFLAVNVEDIYDDTARNYADIPEWNQSSNVSIRESLNNTLGLKHSSLDSTQIYLVIPCGVIIECVRHLQ